MKALRILPILPIALLLGGCGDKTPPPSGGMEGGKAGETRVFGGIEMVWCPPGSFVMGSRAPLEFEVLDWGFVWGGEDGRSDNETLHRVTLTKGFWLAKTETTQRQWEEAMGDNPSLFKGPDRPVEKVSWDEVQKWLAEMNRRFPLPEGWVWELPTEAQWEYACRAGAREPFAGSGNPDDMGWYAGNSGGETKEVATKLANNWGLHDLHGNVWEWCRDLYGDLRASRATDPGGPSTGSYRAVRGGGWFDREQHSRAANRNRNMPGNRNPFLGFRPAAVPSGR